MILAQELGSEQDYLVASRAGQTRPLGKEQRRAVWQLVQVLAWQVEGIEPHAIGVAARSGYLVKQAGDALAAAGVPTVPLSSRSKKNAVRVGTMHEMKGLEFQAVAIFGVANGTVPSPAAVTSADADPVAHAQDLQRERCLLFVACTRARDHLYLSYSGSPSPFLAQG